MKDITYCTKTWRGEFGDFLGYHPKVDLVIGNNLGFKFHDMGDTADHYYLPELEAVKQCKTKYILWYAADVTPPKGNWVKEALPLLKKYPIVSPFWTENYSSYADYARREAKAGFEETDFGFADHAFSDQAYVAETKTMRDIDYDCDHSIKSLYPIHGGNSFECRVAQWLATTGKKRAVLSGFQYRHTTAEEKNV